MRTGTAIRLTLVAAFAGLFGHHALRHALPGLGLVERHDLAAVIRVQDGRTLHYDLVTQQRRKLGTVVLGFGRDEQRVRLTTSIRIQELGGLVDPALVGLLAPSLAAGGGDDRPALVDVELGQLLDEHLRLAGLDASGSALGQRLSANAAPVPGGLAGTWRFGARSERLVLDGLGAAEYAGIGFGMALPPRLKPGDRFRQRVLGVAMAGMQPSLEPKVYEIAATAFEQIGSPTGPLSLLRVAQSAGGVPQGTLWCAEDGTIHRLEPAGGGMALVLMQMKAADGVQLWPVR
jgi:hypothetical protein